MSITIRTRELKNGSRTIYLDFYEEGKRWREYLGLYLKPEVNADAKRENENAMNKAVEIKAQRSLGKEKDTEENHHTPLMSDWMQSYLARLERTLKPDSYRHHRILVDTINEFLKKKRKIGLRVDQFNKSVYLSFLSYLKNDYRVKRGNNEYSITPTTLFNKQRMLNQMLNTAVKDGYLSENPYHNLEYNEKYHKPSHTREYLTKDEVERMIATPTHSPRTKQGFIFCCFTGLRLSDLQALTWKSIRKNSGGQLEICLEQQKTGGQVIIPLGKRALEWLPERGNATDNDKVFDLPERTTCRTRIKALARRAGITKDINFHTSRHTFATLTIAAGVDLKTVSKLLGHTSIKTTQIYADVLMETKVEAVNSMASVLTAIK